MTFSFFLTVNEIIVGSITIVAHTSSPFRFGLFCARKTLPLRAHSFGGFLKEKHRIGDFIGMCIRFVGNEQNKFLGTLFISYVFGGNSTSSPTSFLVWQLPSYSYVLFPPNRNKCILVFELGKPTCPPQLKGSSFVQQPRPGVKKKRDRKRKVNLRTTTPAEVVIKKPTKFSKQSINQSTQSSKSMRSTTTC